MRIILVIILCIVIGGFLHRRGILAELRQRPVRTVFGRIGGFALRILRYCIIGIVVALVFTWSLFSELVRLLIAPLRRKCS